MGGRPQTRRGFPPRATAWKNPSASPSSTGATIRLYDTAVGHEDKEPMTLAARSKRHPEPAIIQANTLHESLDHEHTLCALEVAF